MVTFEKTIESVNSLGGDTDTVAAITGALAAISVEKIKYLSHGFATSVISLTVRII